MAARMSSHVLFVAPYFSANILHSLDALCSLPDVRVGVITQEPKDRLHERHRGRIAGHYQIGDCLDAEQLTAATRAFQGQWGRIDRLLGFLEQMQLPLAIARARTADIAPHTRRRRSADPERRTAAVDDVLPQTAPGPAYRAFAPLSCRQHPLPEHL